MDINASATRRIGRPLPAVARRPLLKLGLFLIKPLNRLIRFTRFGKSEFYPLDQLAWTKELESNWRAIRGELDSVISRLREVPNAQDAYAGQEALTRDDKWKTFVFLRGAGRWEKDNCLACPHTKRLLARVPGLEHAMFSILAPGKKLPAHCGPYAGLIDCHLGLQVPSDPALCQLRVGSTVVSWEEGKMFVFDDTFEHEVWNDSDSLRAVLLLYVVRPLPFPLSAFNMSLMRFLERVL